MWWVFCVFPDHWYELVVNGMAGACEYTMKSVVMALMLLLMLHTSCNSNATRVSSILQVDTPQGEQDSSCFVCMQNAKW
jgi:hypothetical protein